MKQFSLAIVVAALASVAGISIAAQTEPQTIAGCLQKADTQFVLVAASERYQVEAGAGVELAPHVNHRVELTGTVEKSDAGAVIKATALKMVADSCQ